MNEYQGHRSWNAWNVSLWLFNEESWYRLMIQAKTNFKSERSQVKHVLNNLPKVTPDGGKFNYTTVSLALKEV
jgi:hypothetical protein